VSGFPPTVTAILLSYNCADVVADAVRSVLSQDCEPMDVIVSDDASTDDTYEALRREVAEYAGPHQVRLRRRDTNSGSKSAHLNDVFPLASGRFVVSFDGDDVAERHRVRRILEVFRSDEQVTAVFSDYAYLNETGGAGQRRGVRHPPPGSDAGRWFARVDAFASGATLAVRRDVVESFGPLDPAINEDVLLPFRASLLGDVCFVDEALVRVRRREASLTAHVGRFASLDAYRAWFLEGIAQARRQLDSRLRDLDRAGELGLAGPDELDALRRVARDSLAEAEAGAGLVSSSLRERIACVARTLRPGVDWADVRQSLFLALAPEAYLKYKRRRR
jgi:glycosyltransferase involved in cell wall biosynthesis